MTRTDLPKFKSPPVNEVAMGVKFEPIEGLTLAHFGIFWATLRDEFGKSEEAIPLGTPTDTPLRVGGGPLPRLWLVHNDEQFLIQLQPNIFYFNWRRRDDDQVYPSYDAINPLFRKYLALYFTLLSSEGLPPPVAFSCDLSYINLITEQSNDAAKGSLTNPFPDFVWRQSKERFLPRPKAVNWHSVFDLPDGAGDLSARVQSATRVADGSAVLRFEIKATGGEQRLTLKETENWFDIAHRAIVLSFVDMTDSDIQREVWKRTDDAS